MQLIFISYFHQCFVHNNLRIFNIFIYILIKTRGILSENENLININLNSNEFGSQITKADEAYRIFV
jgi:hypothetical protein